jgi:anthranilate synthase component II
MRLVMIDNYDSFTYNLVQLFQEFDLEIAVFRHDEVTLQQIERLEPSWICISPGPKDPEHAGISKAVVARFGPSVPLLGVCLGMQAINEVFGGRTCRAPVPVHGKCSQVTHGGEGVLAGIPSPFRVARYHSLRVDLTSSQLKSLAHAEDHVIMAIQHISWPLCGVQFHPESFMSEYGMEVAQNFLSLRAGWRPPAAARNGSKGRFPRNSTTSRTVKTRGGGS